MTPLEMSRAREALISDGLKELAARHGHTIALPRIDGNGEFAFVVEGQYGEGLAAALNRIPVRCGVAYTKGFVLACNNWCRINHFDAERMLIEEGVL